MQYAQIFQWALICFEVYKSRQPSLLWRCWTLPLLKNILSLLLPHRQNIFSVILTSFVHSWISQTQNHTIWTLSGSFLLGARMCRSFIPKFNKNTIIGITSFVNSSLVNIVTSSSQHLCPKLDVSTKTHWILKCEEGTSRVQSHTNDWRNNSNSKMITEPTGYSDFLVEISYCVPTAEKYLLW